KIEHKLTLPPYLLALPIREAILSELERLFLDKVIAKLGLCISVYDIISIKGGSVFPSDGAPTYLAVFNLIMFRPFNGEIITAKLIGSDADGLRLSVGFFDDIYIPKHHMPNPSHYEPATTNSKKGTWYWDFGEEAFPIDDSVEIKFAVQSVSYPPIPVEQPKDSKPFAPMVVNVANLL
ncbi:hypothetical protein TSUD_155510, partial [Trifolium subterraneum]